MSVVLSRRAVLASAPIGVLAAGAPWARASSDSPAPGGAGPSHPIFPAQDPVLVQQAVGLSHRDLDGVKALVEKRPELAKAAWDWGFGDWETAIGAASHVGRPDIVEVLVANGARPDIFTFAMLGNLDAVRAMIEGSPGIQRIPGPHSITLLAHALAGKEKAAPVAEYLRSLGDADIRPKSEPISEADYAACLGVFVFGPHETDRIEVKDRNGTLFLGRAGGTPRGLVHLGDLVFLPVGAPSVRIRFERKGDGVGAVEFRDCELILRAERA